VIASEARALHNNFTNHGNRDGYHKGGAAITTNSPNINLVRDPRWGRAQEVYSEDPLLTSHLANQWIRGTQFAYNHGEDEQYQYLLNAAQCKHFAVYDLEGQHQARLTYDAKTNAVNWAETYSPVFQDCVVRAQAVQVMCSYNAINGVPACCLGDILNDVLRDDWGYQGLVVGDYDAMVHVQNGSTLCIITPIAVRLQSLWHSKMDVIRREEAQRPSNKFLKPLLMDC